jgi:hypothetical protein
MKGFRLMCLAAIAVQSVWSGAVASGDATNPEGAGTTRTTLPPVLRPLEPPDSGQITLPGPAPVAPAPAPALKKVSVAPTVAPAAPPVAHAAPAPTPTVPPAAKVAPLPFKPVESAVVRRPAPVAPSPVAVPKSPAPQMLGLEVSVYCQKQIGHWKESDARILLGQPKRHRPAYDENKVVNGTIYAFEDPTSKYKEVELDFDLKSGNLRTVFVYPPRLTWQECHRVWNGPVVVADAAQGRKFYSYTNRHLDVLVDASGKVISLGWY